MTKNTIVLPWLRGISTHFWRFHWFYNNCHISFCTYKVMSAVEIIVVHQIAYWEEKKWYSKFDYNITKFHCNEIMKCIFYIFEKKLLRFIYKPCYYIYYSTYVHIKHLFSQEIWWNFLKFEYRFLSKTLCSF